MYSRPRRSSLSSTIPVARRLTLSRAPLILRRGFGHRRLRARSPAAHPTPQPRDDHPDGAPKKVHRSAALGARLVDENGPEGLADTKIIALTAYLLRLGTDATGFNATVGEGAQ